MHSSKLGLAIYSFLCCNISDRKLLAAVRDSNSWNNILRINFKFLQIITRLLYETAYILVQFLQLCPSNKSYTLKQICKWKTYVSLSRLNIFFNNFDYNRNVLTINEKTQSFSFCLKCFSIISKRSCTKKFTESAGIWHV